MNKKDSFKNLVKTSKQTEDNKIKAVVGFYFRSWKLLEAILQHIEDNKHLYVFDKNYIPSIKHGDIKSLIITDPINGEKGIIKDRAVIVTGWHPACMPESLDREHPLIIMPPTPIGFLHPAQLKVFYDWLGYQLRTLSSTANNNYYKSK